MSKILDLLLPSEQRMKGMSHAEQITYLNGWLRKARVVMLVPGLLISIAALVATQLIPFDSPVYPFVALVSLFGVVPTTLAIALLSKSRLASCAALVQSETWEERSDVGLLIGIVYTSFGIPYLQAWARKQLARAIAIHSETLTGTERLKAGKAFRSYLTFFAGAGNSRRYYEEAIHWIVPMLEAESAIGSRDDLLTLRAVLKRIEATEGCASIREPARSCVEQLAARLGREATAGVLLRGSDGPATELLRAASAGPVGSDELLRATDRSDGPS